MDKRLYKDIKKINEVMIRPKKSFHVNIMDEFWNTKGIERYKQILDDNSISYSVNEIDYSQQIRTYPIERIR